MNLARVFDEHFLVIEFGPEAVGGMRLALDREKRLTILDTFDSLPRGAKLPHRRLPFRAPTPIVACDSSLAYTALIPVHFIRERIREPLRQVELENFLSQAVGNTINQCRSDAAAQIGADEVDVLLAKSRVVNFTIDNHHVLNPLGFRAQKIEALVELTFTTRDVFEEVRTLTGASHAFFTEVAHAELSMLEKVERSPLRLLQLRPWRSSFYIRESAPIGYTVRRGELGWSVACFAQSIHEAWGVRRNLAEHIYEEQLNERYSPHVSRFLGKLVKVCKDLFSNELDAAMLKSNVYLDTSVPMPFVLPLKRRGMTLSEPPIGALLERFGFTLDAGERDIRVSLLFRWLAPFFENFYDRGHGGMNQWLRQHLNWLGSPVHEEKGEGRTL